VIVTRAIHELGGDPDAATCLAHTALEHVADLDFAGDLWDIDMPGLVHEGTVAGYDRDRRDLAQVSDDVLGDAVAVPIGAPGLSNR
jgi:hypothetical protein